MKKVVLLSFLLFVLLIIFSGLTYSQAQLTLPQPSQKASVSQTIGLTDITINYHSPLVKQREIWGKLVPYNKVWRAGANENTTISFSDPVKIQGQQLNEGTYGLHMIPSEKEWTIIFSKNNWSWGSFNYDETEDALRVKVTPQAADFQEWLNYTFDNPTSNSVNAVLRWEKLKVSIPIELNEHQIVLNHFEKELDNLPGFGWQAWNQAANYAIQNNIMADDAMKWVDKSIGINRNFTNLMTKASLEEKKGDKKTAEDLKKEAFGIETEAEVNTYGYTLLFGGNIDGAIEIFKMNVKNHSDSWNVYDSLGEAYAAKKQNDLAKKNYSKALSMAPENQKDRINQVLNTLN
ncbi:MAG: DUF2911 domain-containing protein [Ignavibacteriaceae bacterium]